FHNTGSGFEDRTAEAGLAGTEGWWNSLAAGDFDNDGDTDYVAGNLGLNTGFKATPEEPVRVHAADFDDNGSIDPILSRYIDGVRYPIASRDQLIDQMIGMKGRFPRHIDYAEATLEETLSEREREEALVLEAVRFESSHLENLGDGTFAVRALPVEAQVAPLYGLLTGDFDGDGNVDVMGVGNTTAPDVQTGQYVASFGTLLLGDGAGGFRPDPGFFTDGEGRGLARIALGDGRFAIIVARNSDRAQLFHATGADLVPVQVGPLETHAVITLRDGRTRRVELYHGSSYLSQSSRTLPVPADAQRVVIHDARGETRVVDPGR
ncbi:MAG: VCBS repeat-containing protein, partial [Longimicrobiales bacterium]|nr:VCBS repeat-containing protein [Longimicrobiales bacterium]